MEALFNAGLVPVSAKYSEDSKLHQVIHSIVHDLVPVADELEAEVEFKEKNIAQALSAFVPYPSLAELKPVIDRRLSLGDDTIKPPSIEPLEIFIQQRTTTIKGLKKLRNSMAKHVRNCRISNTVGNSASIIGGTLCFFFPIAGIPVLLAGSATSLGTRSEHSPLARIIEDFIFVSGTSIAGSVIEKRLQKKYTHMLEEDCLAMQLRESNLKDITTWLVTVYSLGYSVSKAGVDFLQLAELKRVVEVYYAE